MIPQAVILMGPTGAGKSALALELARRFHGEIISADSRQIYVGMDIGTAKPCKSEIRNPNDETHTVAVDYSSVVSRHSRDEPLLCEGIPHYLIDILTPDQRYSAAEFRDDARRIVAHLQRRGKLPIVVGGTGFYLRALTDERSLPDVPPDPAFRTWAETQPVAALAEELRRLAPDRYARVDHLQNRRRVTRYLEIARALKGRRERAHYRYGETRWGEAILKIALIPPPAVLRKRIEERVDEQLRRGLIAEVRRLVDQYGETAPGLQAVGYRQVSAFLRGLLPASDLRTAITSAHWGLARRQRTWLRREPNVRPVQSPTAALRLAGTLLRRPKEKGHQGED